MREDNLVMASFAAAILILLGGFFWLAKKDAEEFAAYREANHCKEAGYIAGHSSTGYGVTSNGKMGTVITHTPRKTRWLCDNNVEIFR